MDLELTFDPPKVKIPTLTECDAYCRGDYTNHACTGGPVRKKITTCDLWQTVAHAIGVLPFENFMSSLSMCNGSCVIGEGATTVKDSKKITSFYACLKECQQNDRCTAHRYENSVCTLCEQGLDGINQLTLYSLAERSENKKSKGEFI